MYICNERPMYISQIVQYSFFLGNRLYLFCGGYLQSCNGARVVQKEVILEESLEDEIWLGSVKPFPTEDLQFHRPRFGYI